MHLLERIKAAHSTAEYLEYALGHDLEKWERKEYESALKYWKKEISDLELKIANANLIYGEGNW